MKRASFLHRVMSGLVRYGADVDTVENGVSLLELAVNCPSEALCQDILTVTSNMDVNTLFPKVMYSLWSQRKAIKPGHFLELLASTWLYQL